VDHTEFTGADLMLHARAGDQVIVVRAEGKHAQQLQQDIQLGWDVSSLHWFDKDGLRIVS
jgi:ABC-type sugar transport system ATPase subunit